MFSGGSGSPDKLVHHDWVTRPHPGPGRAVRALVNKLKSTFALSALLLTGLALSACTEQGAEVDEDERPAVVETTELVPSPYPSVSVSVSPSTSVKPST